jgi:hypothetical protein
MNRNQASRITAILVASLLAGGTALAATNASPLPAEQKQGAVAYLTGGVGEGQAKAFEQAMSRYPLAIEIVQQEKGSKHDAFTADAQIRITDHAGKQVLDAKAGGPFVLARLEPGKYSIAATYDGHTMNRNGVTVAKDKTAREVFVFPAGK